MRPTIKNILIAGMLAAKDVKDRELIRNAYIDMGMDKSHYCTDVIKQSTAVYSRNTLPLIIKVNFEKPKIIEIANKDGIYEKFSYSKAEVSLFTFYKTIVTAKQLSEFIDMPVQKIKLSSAGE